MLHQTAVWICGLESLAATQDAVGCTDELDEAS